MDNGIKVTIQKDKEKVKIRIPYELKSYKNPEKLTIWKINEHGTIIPVTNARYNGKEVVFRINESGNYYVSYVEKTFKDINKYTWAKESIEILASKGIINGVEENMYAPEKNVTRGDFVKLLVETLDLDSDEETIMFKYL